MSYAVPGRADQVDQTIVDQWNATIRDTCTSLLKLHQADLAGVFFEPDPAQLAGGIPPSILDWKAAPAELTELLDAPVARALSDARVLSNRHSGRVNYQDEYCEYVLIMADNGHGGQRPKRVHVTTELGDYWNMLAEYAPSALRVATQTIIGRVPSWQELYGVDDPMVLTADQRNRLFNARVNNPTDGLNTRFALFLINDLNGLDDLLYTVAFGAKPYASRAADGTLVAPTLDQLFSVKPATRQQLKCRHADPRATVAANEAARQGQHIAIDDPLGVYFETFEQKRLLFKDLPVPNDWIRWSRGLATQHLAQHFEFGPPDDSPAFLDDITMARGAQVEPLTSGLQLLDGLKVGVPIRVGPARALTQDEYQVLDPVPPIDCSQTPTAQVIQVEAVQLGH